MNFTRVMSILLSSSSSTVTEISLSQNQQMNNSWNSSDLSLSLFFFFFRNSAAQGDVRKRRSCGSSQEGVCGRCLQQTTRLQKTTHSCQTGSSTEKRHGAGPLRSRRVSSLPYVNTPDPWGVGADTNAAAHSYSCLRTQVGDKYTAKEKVKKKKDKCPFLNFSKNLI